MGNMAHSESVHLCAELKTGISAVLTVMSGPENSRNSGPLDKEEVGDENGWRIRL